MSLDERSESLRIRTSNGEAYKTIFEWRFSAGSMDLLPQ